MSTCDTLRNKTAIFSSLLREVLNHPDGTFPSGKFILSYFIFLELKSKINSSLIVAENSDDINNLSSSSSLLEKITILSNELYEKEKEVSSISKKYERLLSNNSTIRTEKSTNSLEKDVKNGEIRDLIPEVTTTTMFCSEHTETIEKQEQRISLLEFEIEDFKKTIILKDNELHSLTTDLVKANEEFDRHTLKVKFNLFIFNFTSSKLFLLI